MDSFRVTNYSRRNNVFYTITFYLVQTGTVIRMKKIKENYLRRVGRNYSYLDVYLVLSVSRIWALSSEKQQEFNSRTIKGNTTGWAWRTIWQQLISEGSSILFVLKYFKKLFHEFNANYLIKFHLSGGSLLGLTTTQKFKISPSVGLQMETCIKLPFSAKQKTRKKGWPDMTVFLIIFRK